MCFELPLPEYLKMCVWGGGVCSLCNVGLIFLRVLGRLHIFGDVTTIVWARPIFLGLLGAVPGLAVLGRTLIYYSAHRHELSNGPDPVSIHGLHQKLWPSD